MPESATLTSQYDVYISLVWLLVIVITVLALFLCYLHLSMRRALEREQTGLDFSLLAIEALEAERRRVARELHDTVLPLVRGDAAVSDLVRSICMELMPPDFDRLSLKDSLADLCMQFARRTGIECACLIEEAVDFSPFSAESRLHLYRIVQESLANIEKHSRADKASLVVRRLPQAQSTDHILICVSDDGRGLSGREGLGMRSIRQRAVVVGAKLDFISESGNGLMVRVELSPPPPPPCLFQYFSRRNKCRSKNLLKNNGLTIRKLLSSRIIRLCAKGLLYGFPARAGGKWRERQPVLLKQKSF